ncbi:MAG: DNA primase [Candidatus Moranbacteria bacterium]|nr:DNA primase [Candidatus Moranbacteria bacterium]
MSSDVELVKSRVNIVDIVGEYVKLIKTGSSLKANCPFHQEKTPSFIVNEDKQFYHCFGCNQSGDILTFIMEIEGIGFQEALKMLAERSGVELQNNFSQNKETKQKNDTFYSILDLTARFYAKQLFAGNNDNEILKYLRERGMSDEIIKKFKIGFAPKGWNYLENFLVNQNFTKEDIFEAGLLVEKNAGGYYDRFRNRIIFPIADSLGRVVGFTARVLPGQDESQAKYVNTPESPLYHKSSILYGIDLAKQSIKQKDQVIIMEGNMDVMAAWQADVENVVAVSGTALTDDHIKILKRYTKNFVLFFDSDDAGMKAVERSAKTCLSADVSLSIIILKEGKDAADIVKDDPEKLKQIISEAKNVIVTFIDLAKSKYDFSDPHDKRLAVDEVVSFVSKIDNKIEREAWISKCADIFNVEEKVIFDIVDKYKIEDNKVFKNYKSAEKSVQKNVSDEIKNSRLYRLYKIIALMMLSYPHVWKHIYDNKKRYSILKEHNFLAVLIREGPDCNFEAGNFVSKDNSRENIYKEALNFKQRYEIEHYDESSPISDMEDYIKNVVQEKNKQEITRLTQELKKVQKTGDYQEQKNILEKINQASKNLVNHS